MSTQPPTGIAAEAVDAWLTEHVGLSAPCRYELLAGGHSNLTFRVIDATGSTVVLRRPPVGKLLASAHDMAREHRIISAVGRTGVPVPRARALCEDNEVNEAPFYVMSWVDGVVLHNAEVAAESLGEQARGPLAHHLIDVLAELHTVDPDEIGLGQLGKREDYIGRQLRRWARQWEASKTRELPLMEAIHARLTERVPDQAAVAIVHGDYRLGNCLSDVDSGRISAVLDWELCTLGDPLADVGYLMNNWMMPGEANLGRESAPTSIGGFPGRDELLERYAGRTGFDVSGVDYYRAFSYWRLAAIVEGVLARYLAGQMGDAEADTEAFRAQVEALAAAADEALERQG